MKYVYVVAADMKEAKQLVAFGSETLEEAEAHLRACREPPTDPFYGNRLSIYRIDVDSEEEVVN